MQTTLPFMEKGKIEGMPTQAWIHRRFYPSSEEAIADAREALKDLRLLYVIKHKVPQGFEQYWPDKYYWQISERPPFTGAVGSFYYERPDFYMVGKRIMFLVGEDEETVTRKRREVRRKWQQTQAGSSGKQLSLM